MVPLSGSDVSAQDIEQLLRTLGASPVYAGFTPGGPTAVDISYHQTLPKSCRILRNCASLR